MREIALYHPRIHFPSDAWVKTAALYWMKIARIIPWDYRPHDSETVKELADKLGFVLNVSHHPNKRDYCFGTLDHFVMTNHEALRGRYGLDQEDHPANHRIRDPRDISEAHVDLSIVPYIGVIDMGKEDFVIISQLLVEYELATVESHYLLMHPVLARVCMSILAENIAERDRLRPITDDNDAYAITGGWTESRLRNVLLPDIPEPEPKRRNDPNDRVREIPPAIGLLAIQAVIPRDIDRIPVGKIIQLREQYALYFSAFRDAADAAATEITTQLQEIDDAVVVRAYLDQEVQERLLAPSRQLRQELRKMKVDAATATLTSKYEIPALAGLVATGVLTHQPLIAGGSAAAIGLLGHLRGMRGQVQATLRESPVSYLMLIQDALTARTRLERAAEQIRRITGSS